jgi:glycosyltransferase involved in cell wall biosynthesis
MKTLVLIPAFNEAENLSSVISEVRSHLSEYDIVVVNDGSIDQTASIASSLGVGVISHPVNFGYGAAVQTGFLYAARKGYDIVLLMDGDGQHDAQNAPALIQALKDRSADVVIGSRFLGKGDYKISFARTVGRNLFSLITYLITRKSFLDISSGFQAIDKRAVAFLSRNYPVDFPDAEVIIMLLLNGFKVTEIPAHFRQRTAGKSMFSLSRIIYYPFKVLLAVFIIAMRQYFKPER